MLVSLRDRLCRAGAAVKNLVHGASLHTGERTAASTPGSRHLRFECLSGTVIAHKVGRPVSTIGVELRCLAVGLLAALDPPREIQRLERERFAELKMEKIGRIEAICHRITDDRTGQRLKRTRRQGVGWGYLHVAIEAPPASLIPRSCLT